MILFISVCSLIAATAVCLFFRRAKRALIVLVYDKIGRAPANSRLKNEWTSPSALERTLKTLARRQFTTVLPAGLTQKKLPAKPVMLAFMGGYQSFYTQVLPLLQKYNAKACVFLAQPYAGAYNAWQDPYQEPWQNILTPAQIKEAKQSGLVEFGALDLHVRDVTILPAEEAVFGLEENLFRLKKQLGLNAQSVAFWPAGNKKNAAPEQLVQRLKNFICLTRRAGVNEPDKRTLPLKTLRAGSLRARLALWARR